MTWLCCAPRPLLFQVATTCWGLAMQLGWLEGERQFWLWWLWPQVQQPCFHLWTDAIGQPKLELQAKAKQGLGPRLGFGPMPLKTHPTPRACVWWFQRPRRGIWGQRQANAHRFAKLQTHHVNVLNQLARHFVALGLLAKTWSTRPRYAGSAKVPFHVAPGHGARARRHA